MPRGTAEQRFWAKVDRSAGPGHCWPWQGSADKSGFGRFYARPGSMVQAHRWAWMWANGVESMARHERVWQSCGNRMCCNPRHLKRVLPRDDPRQAVTRAYRCKRGHILDPTKDRLRKDGPRFHSLRCRECENEGQRARRARRGA